MTTSLLIRKLPPMADPPKPRRVRFWRNSPLHGLRISCPMPTFSSVSVGNYLTEALTTSSSRCPATRMPSPDR